jgi:glycosyltransferase involved in cell wall biosynthesis
MADRIRVLQVITGLGAGGAERILLNLVKGLDESRFETRLAVLNPTRLEGLDAYGFGDTKIDIFDLNKDRLRNIRALAKTGDDYQPHVIHAHMFHALMATFGAATMFRVRPAICFTGHNAYYLPMRRMLLAATKYLRDKDIIFSTDANTGLASGRTVVIPNGVALPQGAAPRNSWRPGGPIRMLAIGRLSEQKDCLGAVRSIAAAELPGSVLDFIGTGPLRDQIADLAAQLNVQEQIKLSGFSNDVYTHMNSADVFVMHSRWEGMPMALLEAGAAGMPVIATPVGSIPEILGDDRGIVATAEEFPTALRRLAADPAAAIAMGERLRAHIAANYSIASTVRSHERLYHDLATKVRSTVAA